MNAQNDRTALFSKIKQVSISTLSLVICGVTATSALAETYSNEKCAELSWQYDYQVQTKQNFASIAGMCEFAGENICTRTDHIEAEQIQDGMDSEITRLKDELITHCPAYTEGL